MSGETLYMAIYAMETQETALQRQLAAMNRTVEEMELRYELGQISALAAPADQVRPDVPGQRAGYFADEHPQL